MGRLDTELRGAGLDPGSMTEEERLEKRRYQAYHAFEQMPPMVSRAQFGPSNPPSTTTPERIDQ